MGVKDEKLATVTHIHTLRVRRGYPCPACDVVWYKGTAHSKEIPPEEDVVIPVRVCEDCHAIIRKSKKWQAPIE